MAGRRRSVCSARACLTLAQSSAAPLSSLYSGKVLSSGAVSSTNAGTSATTPSPAAAAAPAFGGRSYLVDIPAKYLPPTVPARAPLPDEIPIPGKTHQFVVILPRNRDHHNRNRRLRIK